MGTVDCNPYTIKERLKITIDIYSIDETYNSTNTASRRHQIPHHIRHQCFQSHSWLKYDCSCSHQSSRVVYVIDRIRQ